MVALVLLLGFEARVAAADSPLEVRARKAFIAGEYDQAIDMFAQLYAETLHPVYLRNLGRCYQKRGDAKRVVFYCHD